MISEVDMVVAAWSDSNVSGLDPVVVRPGLLSLLDRAVVTEVFVVPFFLLC